MGFIASIRPIRGVVLLVLCLSLWGCGLVNPRPPRAVIEGAIAQTLSQTQTILYRELTPAAGAAGLAQVSGIRIRDHHWSSLANQPGTQQPMVEVVGTYHLKGGGLTPPQRRQVRAFDIYLQRGSTQDDWRLLAPRINDVSASPQWITVPVRRSPSPADPPKDLPADLPTDPPEIEPADPA